MTADLLRRIRWANVARAAAILLALALAVAWPRLRPHADPLPPAAAAAPALPDRVGTTDVAPAVPESSPRRVPVARPAARRRAAKPHRRAGRQRARRPAKRHRAIATAPPVAPPVSPVPVPVPRRATPAPPQPPGAEFRP